MNVEIYPNQEKIARALEGQESLSVNKKKTVKLPYERLDRLDIDYRAKPEIGLIRVLPSCT